MKKQSNAMPEERRFFKNELLNRLFIWWARRKDIPWFYDFVNRTYRPHFHGS